MDLPALYNSLCGCLPISILAAGVVACGGDCDDSYPAGTRLTVTVLNAFEGCHVTFEAGQTYALVADAPFEKEMGDGATCKWNAPTALPDFKTTEFESKSCGNGPDPMSLRCQVVIPTCADASGTSSGGLRVSYSALPEKQGDTVSSELRLTYAANQRCPDQSCTAVIPATVRW